MDSGTFDISGLMKWGVSRGLGLVESRTGLDLQSVAEPLANYGMKALAFEETIELGIPLTLAFSVIAGAFKRQKELEARRAENDSQPRSL